MDVIQLDKHRPASMQILMVDITTDAVVILGSESGSGELIMARLVGNYDEFIGGYLDDEGVYSTAAVLQHYNLDDNDNWETLRLDAYISKETLDKILTK